MEAQDLEKLAAKYIQLRTAVKEKEEEQKKELAPLKENFEKISDEILTVCNEQNLDSVRTAAGTISRRISSRYWASDWAAMDEFILKHEAPFLLERRIHNGNMKQFLEENPDDMPVGLQADRKYVVQVRKPTTKA